MINSKEEDKESSLFEDIFIKDYTYFDVLSKADIWKELEKILNGKFKIVHTRGEELNSFYLEFDYKSIKIKMTETDTKPLKIEFELNLRQHLNFNISWEDNIDKFLKYLGKNEVEIGVKDFDNKYLIESSDKTLTQKIFKKQELIDLILKTNMYIINCKYNTKDEKTELLTVANRNIDTIEKLLDLIKIQILLIDSIEENNLITN